MKFESQLQIVTAAGVPPFTVNQTAAVINLNADLLDGQHGSFYQNAGNLNAGTLLAARLPAFTGGDVTSTAGAVALTLANSGVGAGTYRSVTVDAKGRVTAGTNPTTLAGYGITDALNTSGTAQTKSGNLTLSGQFTQTGEALAVDACARVHSGNIEAFYQLSRRIQSFLHLGSTTVLEIEVLALGGYAGEPKRTTWRLSSRSALYVTRTDEHGGVGSITLKVLNDTSVPDANGQSAKYVVGLICGSGSGFLMYYMRARFVEDTVTSRWVTIAQMATATPTTVSGSAMTYSGGWAASAGYTDTSFTEVITDAKARQLTLTAATGTAPMLVSSTTLVSNLNSDFLDGQHGSYFEGRDTTAVGFSGGTLTLTRAAGNLTVSLDGRYLPLSGGTLTEKLTIQGSQPGIILRETDQAGATNKWIDCEGGTLRILQTDNGYTTFSSHLLLNSSGNLTILGTIQGTRLISTIATGTAPLSITSTTLVSNLNSDLLDGQHGAYYENRDTTAVGFSGGTLTLTRAAGNLTVSLDGRYLPLSGGTMTGYIIGAVSGLWNTYNSGSFTAYGNATNPALIAFHRPGYFATNLGLDTDGVIKIGGWSNGGPWPILHSNNFSSYALPLTGGTITGQLSVNGATASDILRLYITGSTVWKLGVTDASGSLFNITADFGNFTINKTNGNVTTPGAFVGGNFSGPGTGLTGTAASLTAGSANAIADGAVSTTAKLANSVVTYAKIQNVAVARVLGNSSASVAQAPQEITMATLAGMLSGQTMNISGSATSVPWSGVTGKPTTLSGYGITDALDTSGAAQTKSGNLTVNGALTSGGAFYAATTVKYSNRQQIYTIYHGGAQDLNWKKIADVVVPTGLYRGVTFKIDVVDNQGNFGWNSNCFTLTYFASCIRSGGVQDDFNNATVTGPVADYVRVVKTATGVYELQIRQIADWQTYIFTAEATINSGGSVTYVTSPVNGSTTGTIYTATATAAAGWTSKLANIAVAGVSSFGGQITSTVATGTAPLVIASTTAVTNLNSDLLDGQHGSYFENRDTTAVGFSGGTLTLTRAAGNLTVNLDGRYLPLTGGTVTGELTISTGAATGLRVNSPSGTQGFWLRVGYDSNGTATPVASAFNTMLQSSGSSSGTFSIVCGNTKVASISTGAVNSLVALQQGGNQVLHAGNVSTYALPIGGGTVTGNLAVNGTLTATGIAYANGGLQATTGLFTGPLIVNNDNGVRASYDNGGSFAWLYGYGVEFGRVTSYVRPNTNRSATLFVGGPAINNNDWLNIDFYSSGRFTINNNAILHAGTTSAPSLSIGGNAATTSQRAFSGDISSGGQGRFTGWYSGGASSGLAAEIGMSAGEGYVMVYNRSSATWGALNLQSSGARLQITGSVINAVTGSLQQGGNQVLHAGNVSTYAFAKSGSWAADLVTSYGFTRETGMQMTGGSEFVVLSKSGQGYLLVDGSYIAAEGGGFYSTNNSSGATLLGFYADTTASLNFNTTAVKLSGNQILHAGNYNSYALPLTGGTLTGALNSSSKFETTGNITGATFYGAGTGLTGTAASLTAGAVPWTGVTGKPTTLSGYGITDALPISAGVGNPLTGQTKIKAGHSTTRLQLHYNHDGNDNSASAGFLTLWASEPGLTYPYTGIGGNIHINGQYYGRQGTGQPYGLFIRFNVGDGHTEFWNTTGTPGAIGGQGTRRAFIAQDGEIYATANTYKVIHAGNYTSYPPARWATGRTISLTGDVTGTSGTFDGTANLSFGVTIANSAVTYAKIQNVAVSTVLGNSSASVAQAPQALSMATLAGMLSNQTMNVNGSSASCTGNAATATSSPLLSALSNYVWSASTLPTGYNQGIQASFVSGSQGFQNYGSVVTVKTYSSGGGTLQLYVPYSPTYGGTGMQVRFGNYDVSNGNSWTSWKTLLASDNYTSYSPSLTGSGASGTWGISITGSSTSCSGNAATATNLSANRTNWVGNGVITAVVGQLAWKNYNNGHTIFDASAGTSPSGTAVNNANAQVAWTGTYPTLMGWNGSSTYGVRVDSARVADSAATATNVAASGITGQVGMWTSAARPGPYRLYRRDANDGYSVQTYWTGSRWRLYGYNADTAHADTHVGYADSAGSASSASSATNSTQLNGQAASYYENRDTTAVGISAGTLTLTRAAGNLTTTIGGRVVAWCEFNGNFASTGSPNAAFNVSSITKNATGDYTINFTSALANTNYVVAGYARVDTTNNTTNYNLYIGVARRSTAKTTTSCRIGCEWVNSTLFDAESVGVAFIAA